MLPVSPATTIGDGHVHIGCGTNRSGDALASVLNHRGERFPTMVSEHGNFVSGDPSAGDITSLPSSPSDSHSCGWLTSEELETNSAERPKENIQLGVQRPLHRHCDECRCLLEELETFSNDLDEEQ